MSDSSIDPEDDTDDWFNFVALLNAVAEASAPAGKTFEPPFTFHYEDEQQVANSGTGHLDQTPIFDHHCSNDDS